MDVPDTRATARSAEGRIPAGRMLRFGVVGAIGVGVNQGLLVLLHGGAGLALWLASPVAIEASILGNFVLNRTWTWRARLDGSLGTWLRSGVRYHAATAASAFAGNVGVLLALVHLFSWDYRLANLVGIGAAALLNFLAGELWVFRQPERRLDPE
jgi:putative flippase GtrA